VPTARESRQLDAGRPDRDLTERATPLQPRHAIQPGYTRLSEPEHMSISASTTASAPLRGCSARHRSTGAPVPSQAGAAWPRLTRPPGHRRWLSFSPYQGCLSTPVVPRCTPRGLGCRPAGPLQPPAARRSSRFAGPGERL